MVSVTLRQDGPKFWNTESCFSSDPLHLSQSQVDEGCDAAMHAHAFYEMNIILRGSGYHFIENKCIPVTAGSIFIIPPDVLHGFFNEANLDVFNLLIKKEFIQRYCTELKNMPGFSKMFEIEPYLRQVCNEKFFLQLSPGEIPPLMTELNTLLLYIRNKYYGNHNAAVLNLIGKLCLRMHQDSGHSAANPDMICIMEYIRQHISEKITLNQLAGQAHMSLSTLNRLFNKTVNMSPMEYVTKCRIDMARNMLEENTCSKTEVAAKCGFYDLSHMNKFLKANTSDKP